MKRITCILLAIVMLSCAGCGKQSAYETQPSAPSTTTNPVLSLADFDQIEIGMLLSEAVEILGYRGRFTVAWWNAYEYTTSENIIVTLWCDKVDENTPKYDNNMVIRGISKQNSDGKIYEGEGYPLPVY